MREAVSEITLKIVFAGGIPPIYWRLYCIALWLTNHLHYPIVSATFLSFYYIFREWVVFRQRSKNFFNFVLIVKNQVCDLWDSLNNPVRPELIA